MAIPNEFCFLWEDVSDILLGNGMMEKGIHFFEYLLLRAVDWLINLLPYRAALALAWMVAGFLFHVVRMRRRTTFERIRSVFGEATPSRELKRIAWLSLRNISFNMVEMMRAPSIDKAWIDQHIPNFGARIPIAFELIQKHHGLVFAVPHTGNWDLAGWACNRYGLKMFSISALQRNPYINAWMNHKRRNGIAIFQRGGGMLREVLRALKSDSAFAILSDVRMPKKDLSIPFFGGIANIGRGMAAFAVTANVPIIPAFFMRTSWTQHDFDYFDPIYPDPALDKETNIQTITEKVLALFDAEIRRHPEQWFWYNGRWILDPVHERKAP